MRLKSPIALRNDCKIIWAISMTTKNLYKYVYGKKEPEFEFKFYVPVN